MAYFYVMEFAERRAPRQLQRQSIDDDPISRIRTEQEYSNDVESNLFLRKVNTSSELTLSS